MTLLAAAPRSSPGTLATAYRVYLRSMEVTAALAVGIIVLILTGQVVFRYFLSGSLIWAEELSRFLMVWVCFLFAGVAYERGEMASVDLVTRVLSPRARLFTMGPVLVAGLIFVAVLIRYGIAYAGQNRMQILPGVSVLWRSLTGSTGGFSIVWMYIAIPIGLAILFLHMAGTLLRIVRDALVPVAAPGGRVP